MTYITFEKFVDKQFNNSLFYVVDEKEIFIERIRDFGSEIIRSSLADLSKKRHRMLSIDGKKVKIVDFPYSNESLLWFNERSQNVFGYGFCLRRTGFNPNNIRKLINKELAKKEKFEKKLNDKRCQNGSY